MISYFSRSDSRASLANAWESMDMFATKAIILIASKGLASCVFGSDRATIEGFIADVFSGAVVGAGPLAIKPSERGKPAGMAVLSVGKAGLEFGSVGDF